jgi:tetratricopeptide (TPR) repeat protein
LNKKAIEKFKETLEIDSAHKIARSALAHSLYLDKQFGEAIDWFERSNKNDGPTAVNFRELGLCKINIGQVKQGREAIDKAFELDTSKEMRSATVEDLADIGTLAFSYGKQYIVNGNNITGKNYQHFAIEVLIMAFDFDNKRADISKKIAQYADEVPEKSVADKYRIIEPHHELGKSLHRKTKKRRNSSIQAKGQFYERKS